MKKITFLKSFQYALEGIHSAFLSECHMRIHIAAMILVVILGFVFHISITEWLVCIVLFALVISAEMMNTAIEATVDLVTDEHHELAKKAKDIAAGAVLITAIAAVICGLIIFIPKLEVCL